VFLSLRQILSQTSIFTKELWQVTVYWLSIEAIYPEGAPKENLWGWTTKPRGEGNIAPGAPDAAVTSSDGGISWCPIIWPGDDIRTNQWDLSFELLSEYQNPTVKWVQGA